MKKKQKIQNILDRNFTRGDNAKALNELMKLFAQQQPKADLRKYIHCVAEEISIILDKYEATCPLERQEIIDEINNRFIDKLNPQQPRPEITQEEIERVWEKYSLRYKMNIMDDEISAILKSDFIQAVKELTKCKAK